MQSDNWHEKTYQSRLPDQPPLQFFPRLVTPAFLHPRKGGENCDEGDKRYWMIPVIFRRDHEVVIEANWSDARVAQHLNPHHWLRFWLEPARMEKGQEPKFIDLDQWDWVFFEGITDDILGKVDGITSVEPSRAPHLQHLMQIFGGVIIVPEGEIEVDSSSAYFWLRMAPRLRDLLAPSGTGRVSGFLKGLAEGDLENVGDNLELLSVNDARDLRSALDCSHTSDFLPFGLGAIRPTFSRITCRYPYKHFWPTMWDLQTATETLALCRERQQHRSPPKERFGQCGVDAGACAAQCHAVQVALRSLYGEDLSPAGVYLDAKPPGSPFTFIVTGDIQEGSRVAKFSRFLDQTAPSLGVNPPDPGECPKRTPKVTNGIVRSGSEPPKPTEAEFVIIAGDLADSEASSNYWVMALNTLGLYPPRSPYAEEYRQLADRIRKYPKPVVAVPGNHDGYAGFPGLLNLLLSLGGNRFLDSQINDYVPVLIKPPKLRGTPLSSPARYDGLAEWRYAMGLTSYAFRFRGHRFFAINSYNLEQSERSAVGAVVFNWGGGLQTSDVDWLRMALDFRWDGDGAIDKGSNHTAGEAFLVMHHDPRAAYPRTRHGSTPALGSLSSIDDPAVDQYGIYNEVESIGSFLTLGHFGFGFSPFWDIYLPVVTPLATQSAEILSDFMAGRFVRHQQEWMRRSFSVVGHGHREVSGHYNAEGLIRLVNRCLARPTDKRDAACTQQGGISHVFLAHDNHPRHEGPWVHWGRSDGVVFPQLSGEVWEGNEFQNGFLGLNRLVGRHLFKLTNDEPPDWAKAMWRVQGNAEVIRLDDLGDDPTRNGYTLVRVDPAQPRATEFWFKDSCPAVDKSSLVGEVIGQ
jgi:hypothetical protein